MSQSSADPARTDLHEGSQGVSGHAGDPVHAVWNFSKSKQRDPFEVLEIIDRVQSRTLQEIQERGCLKLVDAVHEKFHERMQQDKTVKNLVEAEISERLKVAKAESAERQKFNLAVGSAILTLIGLIGYGSIRLSMESYAASAAAKAVEKHGSEMLARTEQAKGAIDESRRRVEQSARDADKSASDAAIEINITKLNSTHEISTVAAKAIADVNAAVQSAKNQVKAQSDETVAVITKSANDAGTKASDVASTKIAAFFTELDATVTTATKAIDRKVTAAKIELDDMVKDATSRAKPGLSSSMIPNPANLSQSTGDEKSANMMVYAELMRIFKQREFDKLPGFIQENNKPVNVDEVSIALRTMLDNIQKYTTDQRLAAFNTSMECMGQTVEQYQVLVEALYAALRVQDAVFTRRVSDVLQGHPLYGAVDSKFTDFGLKVAAKKSLGANPDDLDALFAKVDQSNLTSRGLSNLLYAVKIAGIDHSKAAEVEQKLIAKLIAQSPVSGYADYSDSVQFAVALTAAPIDNQSDVLVAGPQVLCQVL